MKVVSLHWNIMIIHCRFYIPVNQVRLGRIQNDPVGPKIRTELRIFNHSKLWFLKRSVYIKIPWPYTIYFSQAKIGQDIGHKGITYLINKYRAHLLQPSCDFCYILMHLTTFVCILQYWNWNFVCKFANFLCTVAAKK